MHTEARALPASREEHDATNCSAVARAFLRQPSVYGSVAAKRRRRARGLRLYSETWLAAKNLFVEPAALRDWHVWEHRFDDEIKSVHTAAECANRMLASLQDKYTALTPPGTEPDEPTQIETRVLPGDIAYIHILDFHQRNTAKSLRKALRNVRSLKALILDLRGNPGGYTDQAIDCASLLMQRGHVVTFRERMFRSEQHRDVDIALRPNAVVKKISTDDTVRVSRSKRRYHCALRVHMPIAVLVDRDTASAAELLTAALRDNGRATIFGEATFGKGIGQTFHPMPNGYELGITTFYVLTPDGAWAGDGHRDRLGIEPHFVVRSKGRIQRSSLKRDKQLYAAFLHLGGAQ